MNMKTLFLSVLVVMLTSGCSGTYHAYYETLKIAFAEQPAAQMTLAEVQQSPVDVISVKRGERANAIMALAYLENGQHKWVSSDKAMLIMEKGRIVRTLGLKENLLYLANTKTDPLKKLPSDIPKNPWQSAADYSGDQYGYPLESTFTAGESKDLQTLTLNIDTVLFVEKVSYLAPANFMRFNRNWHNYYWYHKQSGELLKTIQTLSPFAEKLQITYLSRIARLNHSLADKQ
jgi:hypothetical protein